MALRSLIVDDNPRFLAAARVLLERAGIEVVGVASNGEEAIRLVSDLTPDVAFVDIDLGEESGFDVARSLAGARGDSGLRVVLISGYSEADFADLIADSPAVGFLPKSDLSAGTINEILRRDASGEDEPV